MQNKRLLDGKRVLIADDQKQPRFLTCRILKQLGCDTAEADNGHDAIKLFSAALNSNNPFHLVMIDMVMEDGLGGLETIRKIRQIRPEQKAIIISGYARTDQNEQQACYTDWLTKPYGMDELVQIVNKHIIGD